MINSQVIIMEYLTQTKIHNIYLGKNVVWIRYSYINIYI